MYTGNQAHDWNALRAQGAAAVQRAESGLPWEQEGPRTGNDQETWLISFIDVLTLLLTMFVLLLAYQQHDDADAVEREPAVAQPVQQQAAAATEATKVEVENVAVAASVEPDADPVVAVSAAKVQEQLPEPPATATVPGATATDAPSGLASLYLTGRVPGEVRGGIPTTAGAHPLLWLNEDLPPPEAAPLPEAETAPRPEPVPDPKARLLAELQRSALAGRVEVNVMPDAVNLEISDNILFAPASAALTEGGRRLLDDLAATLKNLPYELSVEGHTDDVPIRTARYPSNWELASARAGTVTRHLIEQGVAAGRVRAIGYADTRPRAENTTPEGRARNRRVSFILRLPLG